jgi:hypothetical protein
VTCAAFNRTPHNSDATGEPGDEYYRNMQPDDILGVPTNAPLLFEYDRAAGDLRFAWVR